MTDTHQQKKHEGKTGFDLAAAAITGAIVGTGVAIAGAIALKDKKTRDKVKLAITGVKNQAVRYAKEMQKELKNEKSPVNKNLSAVSKRVKKIVRSSKKAIASKKSPSNV